MTAFSSGAMSLAFFSCYLCMNESPFFYSISPISININFLFLLTSPIKHIATVK